MLYVLTMLAVNGFSGVFVFTFIRYGLPTADGPGLVVTDPVSEVVFAVYLGAAGVVSLDVSVWMLRKIIAWYIRGGPPYRDEQLIALRGPLLQSLVHLGLWAVGGVLFGVLTAREMPELAVPTAVTVTLGAIITFGLTYLMGERILRPVGAKALAEGATDRGFTQSVRMRMLVSWATSTLVPAIGIALQIGRAHV